MIDNAPDSTVPLHVAISPTALGRLLNKVPVKGSNELMYRGRVLICTAHDAVSARFLGSS